MRIDPCLENNVGRRRIFWTTRAEACGDYTVCGRECSLPGLEYVDSEAAYVEQSSYAYTTPKDVEWVDGYRSIRNNEWLQGLILNILNTRARNDVRCPTPAAVYGHWSESYRTDGLYIGSTLWNAAEKPYVRTADGVKAIAAAIRADMGKLIALNIAQSVDVEATYVGSGSVAVIIQVTTTTGQSRIELSGAFVSETWVWS